MRHFKHFLSNLAHLLLMWPFSLRRVMRNRWWTLAFAGFVCWTAYDYAQPEETGPDIIALAVGSPDKPMDDQQVQALEQALGAPDESSN
jgi:hypothetical protein